MIHLQTSSVMYENNIIIWWEVELSSVPVSDGFGFPKAGKSGWLLLWKVKRRQIMAWKVLPVFIQIPEQEEIMENKSLENWQILFSFKCSFPDFNLDSKWFIKHTSLFKLIKFAENTILIGLIHCFIIDGDVSVPWMCESHHSPSP